MSSDKDEFRGVGGSYVVGRDGTRKRVEETTDHPEGNRPRDADGRILVDGSPLAETPPVPAPASSKSTPARSVADASASAAENVTKGA